MGMHRLKTSKKPYLNLLLLLDPWNNQTVQTNLTLKQGPYIYLIIIINTVVAFS